MHENDDARWHGQGGQLFEQLFKRQRIADRIAAGQYPAIFSNQPRVITVAALEDRVLNKVRALPLRLSQSR